MSMAPEYVKRLEEIVAEHRALGRKLASLLHDGSMGTAEQDAVCAQCQGLGTFSAPSGVDGGTWVSLPCTCPKGLPFRQAVHDQRIRQSGRERAAGERNE